MTELNLELQALALDDRFQAGFARVVRGFDASQTYWQGQEIWFQTYCNGQHHREGEGFPWKPTALEALAALEDGLTRIPVDGARDTLLLRHGVRVEEARPYGWCASIRFAIVEGRAEAKKDLTVRGTYRFGPTLLNEARSEGF